MQPKYAHFHRPHIRFTLTLSLTPLTPPALCSLHFPCNKTYRQAVTVIGIACWIRKQNDRKQILFIVWQLYKGTRGVSFVLQHIITRSVFELIAAIRKQISVLCLICCLIERLSMFQLPSVWVPNPVYTHCPHDCRYLTTHQLSFARVHLTPKILANVGEGSVKLLNFY
jgi:hypothetical protein